MSVCKNPFSSSIDHDVANKLYCPSILDYDDDDDNDDDDNDDRFFKVIFYYNIKAVHFFANLHLTGLCLYRSTVLLELIGIKDLTFISWDMLIEIHASLF